MTDEEIILRAYELWQETETECSSICFMISTQGATPEILYFTPATINGETGDVKILSRLIGNIFNPVPEFS